MKGYAFINIDGEIHVRTIDFIEIEDPGFFGRNSHWIENYWKFDTEDESTIRSILETCRMHQLPERIVRDFCENIGFDLDGFIQRNTTRKKSINL